MASLCQQTRGWRGFAGFQHLALLRHTAGTVDVQGVSLRVADIGRLVLNGFRGLDPFLASGATHQELRK